MLGSFNNFKSNIDNSIYHPHGLITLNSNTDGRRKQIKYWHFLRASSDWNSKHSFRLRLHPCQPALPRLCSAYFPTLVWRGTIWDLGSSAFSTAAGDSTSPKQLPLAANLSSRISYLIATIRRKRRECWKRRRSFLIYQYESAAGDSAYRSPTSCSPSQLS